ncbi:MAG: hypothetical protein F6K26_09710 [Moorea sp. SIO2I5]|nr:hypothetical protein [Moorena sp. SIO2I5]
MSCKHSAKGQATRMVHATLTAVSRQPSAFGSRFANSLFYSKAVGVACA